MRNTIKTLVLATAVVAGGAGFAMAQEAAEARDTEFNNPPAYSYQSGNRNQQGFGYDSGYRARVMLGEQGAPYAASSPYARFPIAPWTEHQNARDSELLD